MLRRVESEMGWIVIESKKETYYFYYVERKK